LGALLFHGGPHCTRICPLDKFVLFGNRHHQSAKRFFLGALLSIRFVAFEFQAVGFKKIGDLFASRWIGGYPKYQWLPIAYRNRLCEKAGNRKTSTEVIKGDGASASTIFANGIQRGVDGLLFQIIDHSFPEEKGR